MVAAARVTVPCTMPVRSVWCGSGQAAVPPATHPTAGNQNQTQGLSLFRPSDRVGYRRRYRGYGATVVPSQW